jgi:phenylpropionate dioxygenase-like ring-hydroxylating dioxygenase large terminal subunit
MERSTQEELVQRILGHVQDGTTDTGKDEVRYPVSGYYDPQRFSAEVATIFRRYPTIVAHTSQLPRAGDFVTQTVTGIPLVVVRAASGEIRAFLNACRHRGAELLTAPCGEGLTSLVCPYHAWTYGLDGALRHVPDHRCFPGVDKERFGLVSLPVEVRHGFVWATVTPRDEGDAGASIASHLGGLDRELASYGYDQYAFYRQESFRRACNWKSGIESFLENYHFAVLHKKSTDYIFLHNTAAVDRIGRHVRFIAPKRSIRTLADPGAEEHGLRSHATILYAVFPNSCFFIEKNVLSLLQVFPETVSETRFLVTHLVSRDSLMLRSHWERNIELFYAAILEDLTICESMDRGLRSGANSDVIFGRGEVGCHLYRQCVQEALDGVLV